MGEIEWEEPPGRTGIHEEFFDELKANPGEWAIFRRAVPNPGGLTDRLVKGRYRGIKEGDLEVRTHRIPKQGTTIYVRYMNGAQ